MSVHSKHQIHMYESSISTPLTQLLSYPVNLSSYLVHSGSVETKIWYTRNTLSNAKSLLLSALAHWNAYLLTKEEKYRNLYLVCAQELVEHVVYIDTRAGGWPIATSQEHGKSQALALSALVQGNALSILTRAYQLTHQKRFLDVAHLAAETFRRDILDGGVCTPIGEEGIFFEEVAVYPASHALSGFLFGLLGLYDYMSITHDETIEKQITRSLRTLHALLPEFDTGFRIYTNLLSRQLATPDQLTLTINLFEALTNYSNCQTCLTQLVRWKRYSLEWTFRARYYLAQSSIAWVTHVRNQMQAQFFPRTEFSSSLRVCVPVTAFPVAGGMRTVLTKIAQVTSGYWKIEYVTRQVGLHREGLTIHSFSKKGTSPWQFPTVFVYCFAGFWKILRLMHNQARYDIMLPQDGIYTALFTASAAKLGGIRVVCIDHGNITLLHHNLAKVERENALSTKHSLRSSLERFLLVLYWPCLYPFAWLSARLVDHFLIPGEPGDGVEEICSRLGIPQSRLTRFANIIDLDRHTVPTSTVRANEREKNGIPADAIVIAMICRLAPEKGLDIAVDAIQQCLSGLPTELQCRVRVIFAGDGPLREQLERDIISHELSHVCTLRGEITEDEVISLLGLSDIFLFTSRRAAGYPLAIMEAMASGCAMIATNEPLATVRLLSEGRGIVVPIGNVEKTAQALTTLITDDTLRHNMGLLAREHIAMHFNPTILRRTLMRIGYWSQFEELLHQPPPRETFSPEIDYTIHSS